MKPVDGLPDIVLGSSEAKITVVGYQSFCEPCARFHATVLPALKRDYIDTGKVRLVMRAISSDDEVVKAIMLMRCADPKIASGLESTLHETFAHWQEWKREETRLREIAAAAGMTTEQIDRCLADERLRQSIQKVSDVAGSEFGVKAIPVFFVSGRCLMVEHGDRSVTVSDLPHFEMAFEPLLASPARADDVEECKAFDGEVSIAACGEVIKADSKAGWAHRKRAAAHIRNNNFDQGIDDATRAIELDPKDWVAHIVRAQAYEAKDDPQQALADWTTAIEIKPDSVDAYSQRGALYNRIGKLAEAFSDCKKALAIDANDRECDRVIASFVNQCDGDADDSVPHCTAIIANDPKNADAYFRRAYALADTEPDKAIADYTMAIEIAPNHVVPYNNRGNLHFSHKKDFDAALADYTKAVEVDPTYALAYFNRANLYWVMKKDKAAALADYSKAIEVKPDYIEAYLRRVAIFEEHKDYENVIEECERAIAVDRFRSDCESKVKSIKKMLAEQAMLVRPDCEREEGEASVAACSALIAIDAEDFPALFNRARALEKMGKTEDALEDYFQVTKHSAAGALRARAAMHGIEICRAKGDVQGVINWASWVIRNDVDDKNVFSDDRALEVRARTFRAQVFEEKQYLARAIEDCEQAIRIKEGESEQAWCVGALPRLRKAEAVATGSPFAECRHAADSATRITACTTVFEKDSKAYWALINRGLALIASGEIEKGRSDCESANKSVYAIEEYDSLVCQARAFAAAGTAPESLESGMARGYKAQAYHLCETASIVKRSIATEQKDTWCNSVPEPKPEPCDEFEEDCD
jgi:tetratricopeptide (TPR) repeat protein